MADDSKDPTKPVKPIKWLEDNKKKVKRSKKHEDRLAGTLGGRRAPRSGGTAYSRYDKKKGGRTTGRDITTPDFVIEHKHTINDSISLKAEWLAGIVKTARSSLKDPALVITFAEASGFIENQIEKDWIMFPMSVYTRLMSRIEAEESNKEESDLKE